MRTTEVPSSSGALACGGVEFPDLPGGRRQVRVIQLRGHIVFTGLCKEPAEPQWLLEKRQGDIERQVADLEAEGRTMATPEELESIHQRKTGSLLSSALTLGARVAQADGEMVDRLLCFGDQGFGILVPFQCREARQSEKLPLTG